MKRDLSEPDEKRACYEEIGARVRSLLDGEPDLIAALSTVVCELHHGMDTFDWTGFYRVVSPGVLKVGPYQGGHGCLTIPFERGVCGKCAREGRTQIVRDVRKLPYHIACSSTTLSEIVVPVFDASRRVAAVLDIDSDAPGAFDAVDADCLERIAGWVTPLFPGGALPA